MYMSLYACRQCIYACMYLPAAQVFVYCEGHVRGVAVAARHNLASLAVSGFRVQAQKHAALKFCMWDLDFLLLHSSATYGAHMARTQKAAEASTLNSLPRQLRRMDHLEVRLKTYAGMLR